MINVKYVGADCYEIEFSNGVKDIFHINELRELVEQIKFVEDKLNEIKVSSTLDIAEND